MIKRKNAVEPGRVLACNKLASARSNCTSDSFSIAGHLQNIDAEVNSINSFIEAKTNAKKEAQALIKKYEKQQDNVKNNREFDALNKEYNDKMDALTSDASLTKEAQKEKKMALKKEKEGKLMEFLTAEQQAKYKEIIEKKKKEMASKSSS